MYTVIVALETKARSITNDHKLGFSPKKLPNGQHLDSSQNSQAFLKAVVALPIENYVSLSNCPQNLPASETSGIG